MSPCYPSRPSHSRLCIDSVDSRLWALAPKPLAKSLSESRGGLVHEPLLLCIEYDLQQFRKGHVFGLEQPIALGPDSVNHFHEQCRELVSLIHLIANECKLDLLILDVEVDLPP